MASAERHNRKFYIMWDISGWTNFSTQLPADLTTNLKPLGVFNSKAYAHQNGKPVLCIWGIGVSGRTTDTAGLIKVIDQLKHDGYYVIGGTARDWQKNKQFEPVFGHLNMLQPWTVGSWRSVKDAATYQTELRTDHEYLTQHNIGTGAI